MTNEISYKDLSQVLAEITRGIFAPVYLFYGDEFLYKSAFKVLLDAILPQNKRALNYEVLDGATVSVYEIVERLNTFPLLPGAKKVVAVHDTRAFYSSATVDELLRRSKEAFEREGIKGAARYLLHILSQTGISLDEAAHGDLEALVEKKLIDDVKTVKTWNGPWLHQVVEYCLQEQISVPMHEDDGDVLNEAVVAGFPETNLLILTTESVDKRRKLYKTTKRIGKVVNCSMPTGDRAADKRRQKEFLRFHMVEALERAGKTMAPGGFEALYEKTGPALRSFSNELERLVTFVGDRREILADDIRQTSEKTKQDPVYELSNAIGERETQRAIFFVDRLLEANLYPLQVMSAAINQVRKLILAKDVIGRLPGDGWKKGMNFGAFQKVVLPELDHGTGDLLASNAHPYSVYKTFVHSDNYTFAELVRAFEVLLDADIRLKTSSQDAKVILEYTILRICGTGSSVRSRCKGLCGGVHGVRRTSDLAD